MLVYERVSMEEKPTKILSTIQVKIWFFRFLAILISCCRLTKGNADIICRLTKGSTTPEMLSNFDFCSTITSWGTFLFFGWWSIDYSMISFRPIDKDNLAAMGKDVSQLCNQTQQRVFSFLISLFRMPQMVQGMTMIILDLEIANQKLMMSRVSQLRVQTSKWLLQQQQN